MVNKSGWERHLSKTRLTQLVQEACSCCPVPSQALVSNLPGEDKMAAIVGLLTHEFSDKLAANLHSSRFLKDELQRTILPKLKGNSENWNACKREVKRLLANSPPPTTEHFVFPINANPPAAQGLGFDLKYWLDTTELRWLSQSRLCSTSYSCPDFTAAFREFYKPEGSLFNGSFIVVKLKARDVQFAANKALDLLHRFLGLVNLAIHFRKIQYTFGVRQKEGISDVVGSSRFYHFSRGVKYAGP